MYLVVAIDKDLVSVPMKWIERLDLLTLTADGINEEEKHKIFYAKNKRCAADFNLPIEPKLVDHPACYIAHGFRYFSKYFDIFCKK